MKYEEEEKKSKKLSNDAFSMPDSPTGMVIVYFLLKALYYFLLSYAIESYGSMVSNVLEISELDAVDPRDLRYWIFPVKHTTLF